MYPPASSDSKNNSMTGWYKHETDSASMQKNELVLFSNGGTDETFIVSDFF